MKKSNLLITLLWIAIIAIAIGFIIWAYFCQKEGYFDLLGALLGALISGLASLFVFQTGNQVKIREEQRKIYEKGEAIFIMSDAVCKEIGHQIVHFKTFVKVATNSPEPQDIMFSSHQFIKRILEIDIEKASNAFSLLNIPNNQLVNLFHHLDFLNTAINSIRDKYFEQYSSSMKEMSDLYNQKVDNVFDHLMEIFYSSTGEKMHVYENLLEIFKEYHIKYPVRNITEQTNSQLYMNFISKISDALTQNFSVNSEIDFLFVTDVKKCNQFYNLLLLHNNEMVNSLKSYIDEFEYAVLQISKFNEMLLLHSQKQRRPFNTRIEQNDLQ
jgi:hypothetical protein